MSLILAIDPGSTRSGFVVYDHTLKSVEEAGDIPNAELVDRIFDWNDDEKKRRLVVEWYSSHTQASMAAGTMADQARKMLVPPSNPTLDEALAFVQQLSAAADLIGRAAQMARQGATSAGDLCDSATWIGMFCCASGCTPEKVDRLTRKDVLKAMKVSSKGSDAAVRAILIQNFGEGSERKGGALAKVKGDAWQALGLAVVWAARAEELDATMKTAEVF